MHNRNIDEGVLLELAHLRNLIDCAAGELANENPERVADLLEQIQEPIQSLVQEMRGKETPQAIPDEQPQSG